MSKSMSLEVECRDHIVYAEMLTHRARLRGHQVEARQFKPADHLLSLTVPRRHHLVGKHGARITGLAHKNSFETGHKRTAGALRPCPRPGNVASAAGTISLPQEVPDLELPRKRQFRRRQVAARLLVRLCVASEVPFMWRSTWPAARGQSSRRPPSVQSSFATVVAEEAAQPSPGSLRRRMVRPRPRRRKAEREKLRNLLANLDVSIAALTPVAAGDEDINQILRAKAGEAQTGSSPTLGPSDRSRPGSERPRRQTRSTRRWPRKRGPSRLCAKQRLTQQGKDAWDENATEPEAVEAEARIAREGNVQRPPYQVTTTDEFSTVGCRTAETPWTTTQGRAPTSGSTNTALRRNSPCSCLNNCWPKCRQRYRHRPRLFVGRRVQPRRVQPRPPGSAQCGDDIDCKCGGRRQQASCSTNGARVEVSPTYWGQSEAWKC